MVMNVAMLARFPWCWSPLGAAASTMTSSLHRNHRSGRAGVESVLGADRFGGALKRTFRDNRTERVDSEPVGKGEPGGTACRYVDLGHPMVSDLSRGVKLDHAVDSALTRTRLRARNTTSG